MDLLFQVMMIAGSIPYAVYRWGGSDSVLHPYFAVGAWQLASFGIHLIIKNNLFFRKERKHYGITNLWIFGLGLATYFTIYLATPIFILFLFAMLIVGPVMALWYASICFREIKLMTNKELVHLK